MVNGTNIEKCRVIIIAISILLENKVKGQSKQNKHLILAMAFFMGRSECIWLQNWGILKYEEFFVASNIIHKSQKSLA